MKIYGCFFKEKKREKNEKENTI